jgi:transaldolase / glucose-6-phosphate isomerase
VSDDGLTAYGDEANAEALGDVSSVEAVLRAHLQRVQPGDYFALLAYVDMTDAHAAILQRLRHRVRDARRVATCLGFGPRFLHSTGQAYKGGPASGVFLQITCDDPADLPVPGQQFTFGVIKAAQARGDLGVLTDRGRRALRVHLRDVTAGLEALEQLVARVLVEV